MFNMVVAMLNLATMLGDVCAGFTTEISSVPLAMFTLTKWVLGEVNFEAEDANRSASAVAVFVLFVSFVALSK
jgi:hypothetical protein